jgi:hypothetical protein
MAASLPAAAWNNASASARKPDYMMNRVSNSAAVRRHRRHVASLLTAIGILAPTGASAQALFFHVDGSPGDRQAYYSDTIVMSRTPFDQIGGAIDMKQLDVTIIHENAAKPEWTRKRLQFECPSLMALATAKKRSKPAPPSEVVKVRLGEDSSILRRSDLQVEAIPAGSWTTSSDPAMLKAQKLACNEQEINRAITASYRDGRFDMAGFNTLLKPLGLTQAVMVLAETTAAEQLDLTWSRLWRGAVRPDPSGKWNQQATESDRTAAQAKMAAIQQEVDALAAELRGKYEQNVKKMAAGFEFDKQAAKLRGDRKLNRAEAQLVMVWQGRSEGDVVAALGVPNLTEAGDLRVLSYGKSFDNSVVVQNLKSGAAWEEGIYMYCNVDYILMPGPGGEHLVGDVRVSVDSNNNASSVQACAGILEVPNAR